MSEQHIKQNRVVQLDQLVPHARNYRVHPQSQIDKLVMSLQRFGQGRSIVIQDSPEKMIIVAGHGIVEAAQALQWTELRADILPAEWSESQIEGYLVADNLHSQEASDNDELLALLLQEQQDAGFDLRSLGTDDESLRQMLQVLGDEYVGEDGQEEETRQQAHKSLAERFLIPPFSVLDARQGYWQERKRAWIALGIQSELGRGEGVTWGDSEEVTEPGLNYYRNKGKGSMGGTPMPVGHGGLSDQLASKRKKGNAAPGGSLRPAMTLGTDGRTQRGDGYGRPIAKNGKGLARCFGQDLMRGEHTVGQNKAASLPPSPGGELLIDRYRREAGERGSRLTWVAGDRPEDELDETSRPTGTAQPQSGTSIFDPVLCELAYRWFSPPDGVVLDPFAGGSVRGIVAAKVGRHYVGIDLRTEQIEANEQQARTILADEPAPRWIVGDSRHLHDFCPDVQSDLIFTCPPYYDLEVYSESPDDLSTASTYSEFLEDYRDILKQAISHLKNNRFVCVVVGDIRDQKGFYRNFVSDTIAACQDAGTKLYNEAILVTQVGSLPIRVGKQFSSGRKLGKTHQNVLVFVKGDPKKAVEECGEVVVDIPEETEAISQEP